MLLFFGCYWNICFTHIEECSKCGLQTTFETIGDVMKKWSETTKITQNVTDVRCIHLCIFETKSKKYKWH